MTNLHLAFTDSREIGTTDDITSWTQEDQYYTSAWGDWEPVHERSADWMKERERETEEDLISSLSIVQSALESESFLDSYKLNIELYIDDKLEL